MLGIVSPYINLADDRQIKENFLSFQKQMSAFPLFTVELSCSEAFQTNSFLQIKSLSHQCLFQPESILNLLVRQLPADINAIAWIDPRILLLNPNWYEQTTDALKHARIVQLMSNVRWLDRGGLLEPAPQTRVSPFGDLPLQTGAAWAMKRNTFEQLEGLFAWDVVGSGNAWLRHAFSGETSSRFLRLAAPGMHDEFLAYARRCQQVVQGRVQSLPGDALQRFHPDGCERTFWVRHEWLNRSGYCPRIDIRQSQNGLLEWTSNRSPIREQYRRLMELPALS